MTLSTTQLDQFVRGYMDCALWCGVEDDSGDSVSGMYPDALTRQARAWLTRDAKAFARSCAADLVASTLSMERAGHDFWLTRNRHGAGYWDEKSRGPTADKALDRLTEAAHAYGDASLILTSHGKIGVL